MRWPDQATSLPRGRVSAVNSLFVLASNQLGDFRAGLMAAWLGAIPAVLIGGVGALLDHLVELLERLVSRDVAGRASLQACDYALLRAGEADDDHGGPGLAH